MDNITGLPLEHRLEIIGEIAKTCVSDSCNTGNPFASLSYVLRSIYEDRGIGSKSNNLTQLKSVQFVKRTRPDLYDLIRPWIMYIEKEENV